MPAIPSLVRYRKVVNWGLTPQAINFAQSSFMGHRVCFSVPVDFMNQYFTWSRYSRELRPTGRFTNDPNSVGLVPTFKQMIERCLDSPYSDLDGVASGLNYSSEALDEVADMKRDQCVNNYDWDYTGLALATPTAPTSTATATHYSANDLVMAFVLNKCFGSSAFDSYGVIYNLDDGFGMLTSAQLAEAIRASLKEEDDKAKNATMPIIEVDAQQPGDDKGQVDAMFRSLLSIDPQRFYRKGKQIAGLFETNFIATETRFRADLDATGALTNITVLSGTMVSGTEIQRSSGTPLLPADAVLTLTGSAWSISSASLTGSFPVVTAGEFHTCEDIVSCLGTVASGVLTVDEYLFGTQLTTGALLSGIGVPAGYTIGARTAGDYTANPVVKDTYLIDPPTINGTPAANFADITTSTYFTTPTADPNGAGNWCLAVGDKIEIPIRLYFRAPVTVLSVVDGAKNPSSATPDQVETVFIKGQTKSDGTLFDSTSETDIAAANRENIIALRLQILCSSPLISDLTRASSEDTTVPLANQIVNFVNPIFYQGPNYATQTAIALVYAGEAFAAGTSVPTFTTSLSTTPVPGLSAGLDGNVVEITFNPVAASALTAQTETHIVTCTLTPISGSSLTPIVKAIKVTISAPPPA
jgi:hypothetical protein